jgi:hypothetical protein
MIDETDEAAVRARIRELTRERTAMIDSDNEVRPDEERRFREVEAELLALGVNIVPAPM